MSIGNFYNFTEPPCQCVCMCCCCSCCCCGSCICCGTLIETQHRFLINEKQNELTSTTERSNNGQFLKQTNIGFVDDIKETPMCCGFKFHPCIKCFQDLTIHGIKSKMIFPCLHCFLCQQYPVEVNGTQIGTVVMKYKGLCCCPYISIQNQKGDEKFIIQRPCSICCNLSCLWTCCADKIYFVKDSSRQDVSQITHKGCSFCGHEIDVSLPPSISQQEKLLLLSAVDLTWF